VVAGLRRSSLHLGSENFPLWPLWGMTGRLRQQQWMAVQRRTADHRCRTVRWRRSAGTGPLGAGETGQKSRRVRP